MPIYQERIKQFYPAIKIPKVFEEEDRGFVRCCKPLLVLAGGTETWQNDINSAWLKLADPSDTVTFTLEKEGTPAIYQPTKIEFPNEPNAFYATVPWFDVLASDGIGCYDIKVEYNIQGFIGSFMWATYKLKNWSIQNALKTARLRVIFNLKQEVEGIDFTGSNVEDSIRFHGYIGDKQPNTEIDNLNYQDRVVKSVYRENLRSWIITTDPYTDEILRLFTDLYLLSENELFISDYNAHNESYRIQDQEAIVIESPELTKPDRFSRGTILTCKVGQKRNNQRTRY